MTYLKNVSHNIEGDVRLNVITVNTMLFLVSYYSSLFNTIF